MIKITKIDVLDNYNLHIYFDDKTDKIIDIKPFIKPGTISGALLEKDFFKKVMIYNNGRGIFWPNDYDLCPDTLRYHTEGVKELA